MKPHGGGNYPHRGGSEGHTEVEENPHGGGRENHYRGGERFFFSVAIYFEKPWKYIFNVILYIYTTKIISLSPFINVCHLGKFREIW